MMEGGSIGVSEGMERVDLVMVISFDSGRSLWQLARQNVSRVDQSGSEEYKFAMLLQVSAISLRYHAGPVISI